MSLTLSAKELPVVLKALATDEGARQRQYDVLATAPHHAIHGAAIKQTLGAVPVEAAPYTSGGGYRTQSPVFLAKDFGGRYWFGVAPLPGRPVRSDSFASAADVAAAVDHWLIATEAHAAEVRNAKLEHAIRQVLAEAGVPENRDTHEIAENVIAEYGASGPPNETPRDRVLRLARELRAMLDESRGELQRERTHGPYSGGALGSIVPELAIIRLETLGPRGEREHVGDFTLQQMIDDNADDDTVTEGLVNLRRGQSFEVGGGAAQRFRMTFIRYDEPGVARTEAEVDPSYDPERIASSLEDV